MANVYKAKDHKLNRMVAIKMLKEEFRGDRAFVSKFRVEAQAAAGLTHANIVNVYDVGEEGGVNFIVMELVEGITLKEYIAKKGKLPVREATSIALQVAAGLETAHANGIIHRDVKPQNIIISVDGKAKIADFGIARAATSNTINSNVMGSVHYSAPEQTRGGYSDAKSDIYSMGITMYEMLTGRVPYDGDSTVEVALKHLQEEMIPPRRISPEIPRSTEQIILKCTQKSPDRRYSNMTELIRDLKESLVDPDGSFVTIPTVNRDAHTKLLSKDEVSRIKKGSSMPGYDETPKRPSPLEELEKQEYGEREEQRERTRRKKRRTSRQEEAESGERIVLFVSIAAALVIGLVALFLIGRMTGLIGGGSGGPAKQTEQASPATVNVPDILGKSEDEARETLRALGLGYKFTGETASDVYAKDLVASQSVEAGTAVAPNTTVGYQLSSGPSAALTVPDLTRLSLEEAQEALESMNLTYQVDTSRYSDTVQQGLVLTTNPGPGSSVHAGDVVTIYVSQGPDSSSVEVPDMRGKYVDDANAVLSNLGLYVYIVTEYSDTVQKDLVIDQDVEPGSTVPTGTAVTVIVSGGSAPTQGQASGVWMCNAQLLAPDNWDGEPVRIILEQNGTETTIFEGTTTFPYLLSVQGQAGVTGGTVTIYTLDPTSWDILSTTVYDGVEFSQVP